MTKDYKQHLIAIAYTLILAVGVAFGVYAFYDTSVKEEEPTLDVVGAEEVDLGTSESGANWIIQSQFQGLQTKLDPAKIPEGAMANGQNTTSNDGDRISVRDFGFEIFPDGNDLSATTTPVKSLHTFRKRDGSQILVRGVEESSTTSTLEWYDKNADNTQWETLKTGYGNADFGFADFNINTDQSSYVYFGNGTDPFSRWNGAITNLNGALSGSETVITVDSVTDFSATGTVVFCGSEYTYTFASATGTYFVLSSGASACGDNRGVAQGVDEYSAATYPRGNIYLAADNRLFVAGTTSTQQIIYFSAYGDPQDFGSLNSLVSDSTDASAGLFNLAEGGGGVKALVFDENSIYAFKSSLIYKITLSDTIYAITPLKTYDQKSQSTGAVGQKSTFVTSNGTVFVTPDNQIMLLQRVEEIDTPRVVPISDPIQPIVRAADFTASTGITFRDRLFVAAKTTPDSSVNDVIFVYNIYTGMWDAPIVGWNVNDFAIYANDALEEMYFADATIYETFLVNRTPTDGDFDVTASWRSKQHDFGLPYAQKYVENVYVEGYIAENTDLTISLLYDEDGYTQSLSTTLSGDESDYIFDSESYNLFGLQPFGTERFGSQNDQTDAEKFRVFLGKGLRQVPFHNLQIEFASDGEAQEWEVTNYGFLVRQLPVPEKRSLFKSF